MAHQRAFRCLGSGGGSRSRVVLGIRLRFHHHTPEQAAACLAFHQLAANQLRGNNLRWTAAEGVGQGWESVVAMGVAREAQPH